VVFPARQSTAQSSLSACCCAVCRHAGTVPAAQMLQSQKLTRVPLVWSVPFRSLPFPSSSFLAWLPLVPSPLLALSRPSALLCPSWPAHSHRHPHRAKNALRTTTYEHMTEAQWWRTRSVRIGSLRLLCTSSASKFTERSLCLCCVTCICLG
jgi:hypothetical protein